MAHDHHHDDDTYYLDQLCLVALSGAFGAVCLSLYFVQTNILNLVLAPQFHPFVLISGVVLVTLTLLRAVSLWSRVGNGNEHDHAHAGHDHHHHDHDHAHHHHGEHGHTHEHGHEHQHDHEDGHEHQHHGHTHADHEHGWAPWRYVVLLIPVILCMLGLPNRGPSVPRGAVNAEMARQAAAREAADAAALVAAGPVSWTPFAMAGGWVEQNSAGPATWIDFKSLLDMADDAYLREHWANKIVRVWAQFGATDDPRFAGLVRFRIQCCGADAVPVTIPMISKEPLSGIKHANKWVEAVGKVTFRQRGQSYVTVVQVRGPAAITAANPDPQPYLR
jgi:hypothetical protein